MGWSFKRFKDNVKYVGRKVANVGQYVAPVAGSFFGPIGHVLGQGAGLAFSQVGPTKSVSASLKRQLGYGAAVFGTTAGLGLLSGEGAFASPASSVSSLYGKVFGGVSAQTIPSGLPGVGKTSAGTPLTPGGTTVPTGQTPPNRTGYSAGAQQVPSTGPSLFERLIAGGGQPTNQNPIDNLLGGGETGTDWTPILLGGAALVAVVALSGGKK